MEQKLYPSVQQPLVEPQTVVIQPQQFSHTTVQYVNQFPGQWSSEMCDCCNDMNICCFALFCSICFEIKLFLDADEGFCSCIFGGLIPLRTKIRTKYNIEGTIAKDFCAILCCSFCAAVQMANELKKRNISK